VRRTLLLENSQDKREDQPCHQEKSLGQPCNQVAPSFQTLQSGSISYTLQSSNTKFKP